MQNLTPKKRKEKNLAKENTTCESASSQASPVREKKEDGIEMLPAKT